MSSVGEYRRGGLVQAPRSAPAPSRRLTLTAEQADAVRLAVGALVGLSVDTSDTPLNAALTRAAATLQAMLDDDTQQRP